ncbi:hypothetical protein SLA2020_389160 [Shorea laevis]
MCWIQVTQSNNQHKWANLACFLATISCQPPLVRLSVPVFDQIPATATNYLRRHHRKSPPAPSPATSNQFLTATATASARLSYRRCLPPTTVIVSTLYDVHRHLQRLTRSRSQQDLVTGQTRSTPLLSAHLTVIKYSY